MRIWITIALLALLSACTGLPEKITPVSDFEADRYLGTWYEIARLDHRFERGLRNVTATYSEREDGGLLVQNRGYSEKKSQWQDATGKAYFVGDKSTGHLKVSFFGPFYGSYAVFELDQTDYQYAYISGNSTKYLWLLSRTPTVSAERLEDFKARAIEAGFDISGLILVNQEAIGE